MQEPKSQVFQTSNPSRWQRFKWSSRVIIAIVLLLFTVLVTMLFVEKDPVIPIKQDYRTVISADKPFYQETQLSKQYKGFRKFFTEKKPHFNSSSAAKRKAQLRNNFDASIISNSVLQPNFVSQFFLGINVNNSQATWNKFPCGIRSAFFVAWDPQSFLSLKRNISHLNLIMPEWFFIDPKADTVMFNLDEQSRNAYQLMRAHGVAIMPMLSNNFNRNFHPEAARRILNSPVKRRLLINKLIKLCLENHFAGVNVDFESLNLDNNELLVSFIKEMAITFHKNNLLLSEDIEPFNDDYNTGELSKYCDYLVLMAYDEYSGDGEPGPISSQKWIEAAVDKISENVPSNQIILGLGAFGYQWPTDSAQDPSLTYQHALQLASGSGAKIQFNEDTYNLHYSFVDDTNTVHQVFFTDAATAFNTMRFATEYGLAGTAIWRLGSEDDRIWTFYHKDMRSDSIAHFNFKKLSFIKDTSTVDYIGDGEVLDVLRTPKNGHISTQLDSSSMLIAEESYDTLPSSYVIQKYGAAPLNQLVLTFDDGPSAEFTPQILDILSRFHVPAAFFMVGLEAEKNLPIVERVYKEGHLIGDHTFTHPNIAKVSRDRSMAEIKLTRLLIECITGHSTILFRAPYNADSEPVTQEEIIPIVLARQLNLLDIGESIDPEDWEPGVSADTILARVIKGVQDQRGNIILLHDAGGDTRKETVKALPRIIEYFQKRGYTFTSLANIMHKRKDQLMPAVPPGNGYYMMQFNLALAKGTYWISHFLAALFIIFIFLGVARLIFMIVLAMRERRRNKASKQEDFFFTKENAPLVSIIVPAYNEEVNAVSSVANLLKQTYPNFDIIFVNDGSTDATYSKVMEAFSQNEKIKILTKPNAGKASALNYGISNTSAEFVVCIDADTKLEPKAIVILLQHFFGKNKEIVGAVAGNVKVGNTINLMTKWQEIEYVTSQNFDRMAFANINAITVVPGAIGAFRKQTIRDAGGFTTDTMAEDCDLTIRILRAGYVIKNENNAIALTEAPEKIGQFVKQRTRWTFGVMQTFWKHRDTMFNSEYGTLGWIALPNILLYQFIIPLFSPLADILMIIGIFSGNAARIGKYYLLFMLVDMSVALAAFVFEKEKLRKLFWIIPQRFCYRWIMYVVLFKSLRKALRGELQMWGVLKRTGNVQDI